MANTIKDELAAYLQHIRELVGVDKLSREETIQLAYADGVLTGLKLAVRACDQQAKKQQH